MGNESSRESHHGGCSLREKDAWAIAMTYRDQLQSRSLSDRRVRLETDPLASQQAHTIVKSYEWIVFDAKDNVALAASARAAVISWFWLTCCAGYSGHENPQFWKRVFSELQRPCTKSRRTEGTTHVVDESITDAIRFFDHQTRVFPRVKLITDNPIVCQVFLGRQIKHTAQEAWDRKLGKVWQKLSSFVLKPRSQRAIDVAVAQDAFSFVLWWVDAARAMASFSIETPRRSIGQPAAAVPPVPRFQFHSAVAGTCNIDEFEGPLKELSFGDCVHVSEAECGRHDVQKYSKTQIASWLRGIFFRSISDTNNNNKDINVQQPHVHAFTIMQFEGDQGAQEALWSIASLNVQSSMATIRLLPPCRARRDASVPVYTRMDWAWIGYALFHPEAAYSCWRNLEIDMDGISKDALVVFHLMAAGNNFIAVENDEEEEPRSHLYHSARLVEGAQIWSGSGSSSLDDGSSSSQGCLEPSTWVGLCVDSVDELKDNTRRVRVVVPGLGFGWIQATDITEIVSRPPSAAFLSGLNAHMSSSATVPDEVVDFISLVGTKLKWLDISRCGSISAPALHRLLVACPALTTLSVNHDGSLWADWAGGDGGELPRLEQLRLMPRSGSKFHPFTREVSGCSSLRNLKALHVDLQESYVDRHRQAVVDLLETLPMLQYLLWSSHSEFFVGKWLSYMDGRKRTQELVGHVFANSRAFRFAQGAFSMECRAAMLSVVRAARRSLEQGAASAMGRLEEDLLSQIFAFATSTVPRDVWVGA